MRNLKIALDVDGVLADTIRSWLKLCNERFGLNLLYEQIDHWNFWKDVGITQQDFEKLFNEAWSDWKSMPPTEDKLSAKVEFLKGFGEVDIVTGRSLDTMGYVKRWLNMHRIKSNRIVLVEPDEAKGSLDYDVFIDDSPLNAVDAAERGKTALIYDQPWNRHVGQRENLLRVKSLSEASSMIRSMFNHDG